MIRTRKPTAGGRRGGVGTLRKGVTLYVNAVSGSDSNSGLTSSAPKLTLDSARTALNTLGGVGTIRIHAPIETPVQGFVNFASGNITLIGMDGTTPWYVERSATFTSGWTDLGGGIYSRGDLGVTAQLMACTTVLDGNGFSTVLTKNTGTPTTPAAGEFGQTGGNYYVHLPGGVSANSNTIKRASVDYLIRVSGTARVTIRNGNGRYTNGNAIECTASGAALSCYNCTAQYISGNGFGNSAGVVYLESCTGQRASNDGFNFNGGTITAVNCDGSYNDDEGISPHNGCTLTVSGGRYHHNYSGGCTAVGSGTRMNLSAVTVDFNGAKAGGGIESNGINYDTGTVGTVADCVAQNNTGSGYYCNSATVTVTNLTSGTGQGNTQADVTC